MGSGVQEVLSWYQKKIGTYDKQEWEKTVEGRILSSITHVPKKKTAKLKTELIDVDLVRGSSFTKAKPKGGLMAVTKMGVIRLLFLPLYLRWWASQTSPKLSALLLLLYTLQVVNSILYVTLPDRVLQIISTSEVMIPVVMMFLLTILHSNIVSPRSPGSKDLAPFDPATDGWRKRTKRRLRHSTQEKTSDPSSECGGTSESQSKFSKRVRLRKLSFEDVTKTTVRRRRNVAWDTSPTKYHQKLNGAEDTVDLPEPELIAEVGGCDGSPGDDDGFESLNSQGNNDDCSPEHQFTPEAVFRNNWLEQSARRASIGRNNVSSGETDHKDSDSDHDSKRNQRLICRRRGSQQVLHVAMPTPSMVGDNSSFNSSEEEGAAGGSFCPAMTEGTTSAAEWIGITTNSEDCSVSSEMDEHPFASEFHMSPSAILSPSCVASDRVSCTLWEKREVKKADLSVLDISSAIIARVESMPENMDYFYVGMFMSLLVGLVPGIFRAAGSAVHPSLTDLNNWTDTNVIKENIMTYAETAFGTNKWTQFVIFIALLERTVLSGMFFFLVTVAERTFKQRFLYAKFFSHLTSFRRARKSELPHFRLNKVRNIKTWLSVRSYLRKRGPQHSVDSIVSSVFLLTIFLLGYISVEYLKDSDILSSQTTVEALVWGLILGFFLLRFMTLGTKINRKYSNLSVLITEQINLYLQIEQKPNKKEELMVANSVLKLAADLLKELECPYKISGISANPYLYTITKVVILSALSGVLSEMLGFKLKLHKIKIK